LSVIPSLFYCCCRRFASRPQPDQRASAIQLVAPLAVGLLTCPAMSHPPVPTSPVAPATPHEQRLHALPPLAPDPYDAAYIELLRQTVSIPSVTGGEADVSRYLVQWMRRHGLRAHMDEVGNAVGSIGQGERLVVLLGHIDTVPGRVPVRVETNEDGERVLYGRGSVDAKGPFCTFVAALAGLDAATLEKARFVVVGAVEEESPTSKGAHYSVDRYSPDFCIIGEPSGWEAMTLGYKGRLMAKARIEKGNFHSAGDDTTAAEDMVVYWQSLQDWVIEQNKGQRLFDSLQIALQGMHSQSDGMAQVAEATIGFRLPPRFSSDALAEKLEAMRPAHVELALVGREEPYRGPKDTLLTRAMRQSIREFGGEPKFKVKTGTADMNVVAPFWNCPILAYGPGDSSLDHTPHEHLVLSEYLRAIRVLRSALSRLVAR
jgi:[amino group carrier protein]-lysine/ornithine hydrolase